MMTLNRKSSLNDISATTLAAIENIKSGTLPNAKINAANQAAVVFVSGIPILDKVFSSTKRYETLQDLILNTEAYESDQALLSEKLAKAKIKALAFLPTESWNQIRKDSGLYTFNNENGDGTVNTRLDTHSFAKDVARKISINKENINENAIYPIAAVVASVVSQYFIMDKVFPVLGWGFIFAFIGGVVSSVFALFSLIDFVATSSNIALRREIKSAGGILNMLWPDKNEPDKNARSGFKVKVKFPEAPEDVNQTLLKAYKAGIKTVLTTDASAICIETNVFALLKSKVKDEYKAREEFERELAARIKADPIIWVEQGKCVAIISQYGDFRIEKAVIEKVLKENFLI